MDTGTSHRSCLAHLMSSIYGLCFCSDDLLFSPMSLIFLFQNKILFKTKLNYVFQKCIGNINLEAVVSYLLFMIVFPNDLAV